MPGKLGTAVACGLLSSMLLIETASACMSQPDGWYLEANGGASYLSNEHLRDDTNRAGAGGNLNLGYKFLPYVAAEIGYSLYADHTIKTEDGIHAATDKHNAYDIAAKGIWPFGTSGMEGFVKLGMARINAEMTVHNQSAANTLGIGRHDQSTNSYYAGAGLQYYVMPSLALVLQWQRAAGNATTGTEDLFSGGLSFIFS